MKLPKQEKLTSNHFQFCFNFLNSLWIGLVFFCLGSFKAKSKYMHLSEGEFYNRNIEHNGGSNFYLHKEKMVQKIPKVSASSSCNIGKILLITTTACHLVCFQEHCQGMQISLYHKNTILSSQFPHQHVETKVLNSQSIFFKMQIAWISDHLQRLVPFF